MNFLRASARPARLRIRFAAVAAASVDCLNDGVYFLSRREAFQIDVIPIPGIPAAGGRGVLGHENRMAVPGRLLAVVGRLHSRRR